MLNLVFLWHQHQPYYKNLMTGEYLMPWVRLHGVKDYLDMVEILRDYPSIKQVFNFVPSLLEQIKDYADGSANDPHLNLSRKKAEDLSEDDKIEMLGQLFQANYDNLISPFGKYKRLFENRRNALMEWEVEDWRDLQCLSNLAWIDPSFRSKGRLKQLAEKGQRYTEEEKHEILRSHREIVSKIIPTLRDFMETGQIEVSVTPYYHPIMPLIYDTSSALTSIPNATMPKNRFQHPEDVQQQVEMAIDCYRELFGIDPVGMWPSEGSVSEEILPILSRNGIKWIATDEEILAESLSVPSRGQSSDSLINSGELYRAHRMSEEKSGMTLFFRDHALSDNIGFVYSSWDPEKAADDLISRLSAIDKHLTKKEIHDPVVSVILDGENAWEYYKNDGGDFLHALYSGLAKVSHLTTITYKEFLNGNPRTRELPKLFPGSWINHNFSVWIGHQEDNRAWDLLYKARADLVDFQKVNPDFDSKKLELAWREIYIAEGSDWCWWFGDDHVGPHNDEFDTLFRTHLTNVYLFTGQEPPEELFQPVRSDFMLAHISKPIDYLTPVIDGQLSHYYEWNQAGFFDCMKAGSTMHKAENILRGIWFGFDTEKLYLMLRPGITVSPGKFLTLNFEIELLAPSKAILQITKNAYKFEMDGRNIDDIEIGFESILEIAIPLRHFSLNKENHRLNLRVIVKSEDKILETWPPADSLNIAIPVEGSAEIPWII